MDSGNPSECSPLRADGDDHDSLGPLGSNPNFEQDLKQITQKIYSLGKIRVENKFLTDETNKSKTLSISKHSKEWKNKMY